MKTSEAALSEKGDIRAYLLAWPGQFFCYLSEVLLFEMERESAGFFEGETGFQDLHFDGCMTALRQGRAGVGQELP